MKPIEKARMKEILAFANSFTPVDGPAGVDTPLSIIYELVDEVKRLQMLVKKIQKPRGWGVNKPPVTFRSAKTVGRLIDHLWKLPNRMSINGAWEPGVKIRVVKPETGREFLVIQDDR